MNIFLSFLQSEKQHPVPAYDFWQYYIKNGITEAGHQWTECPDVDWARGLVPDSETAILKWKNETWDKTVSWLKKYPSDIFISYLYPFMIDVNAVEEIKRSGIPCVNFYCDHLRDFKKLPFEFSVFDLNWVPEYKAVKLYQNAGYPFINLPMPIWVEPKLRVLKAENNQQITFIGSKDVQRQMFLDRVIRKAPELPLAIYGNGWEKNRHPPKTIQTTYTLKKKVQHQIDMFTKQGILPYLRKINHRQYNFPLSAGLKEKLRGIPDFERYNDLTSASMITVGINRYPSFHFPFFRPDTYSRLRDIEAPMLGACYLTEWTDGIDELYLIGEEIETYRNETEFIEKVKELQADSRKRKNLKFKGQKRALETHNIPSSLNKILCSLGL